MRLPAVLLASACGCGRVDFAVLALDASIDEAPDEIRETLTDRGLVVRYFIDEAASGTSEPVLRDAAPTPFDLLITYISGQPVWTTSPTGRGLTTTVADADGGACADLSGKPLDALNGLARGTIEVVASATACSGSGSRWFHIGAAQEWRFSLACRVGDVVFQINGPDEGLGPNAVFVVDTAAEHVYTAVLDTTRELELERLQLFVDGVAFPPAMVAAPAQNETLDLGLPGERALCVGNRKIGGRSTVGTISYAAAYSVALTPAEVAANAARLARSNDR